MSDSLRPHRLQHARLPYPSPSPGVCSNSGPLSKSREDIKKERRGVKDLVWDRVVGRGAWKEGPGWGRMERGWGWGWNNLEDSQRRKRDQKSPPPPRDYLRFTKELLGVGDGRWGRCADRCFEPRGEKLSGVTRHLDIYDLFQQSIVWDSAGNFRVSGYTCGVTLVTSVYRTEVEEMEKWTPK